MTSLSLIRKSINKRPEEIHKKIYDSKREVGSKGKNLFLLLYSFIFSSFSLSLSFSNYDSDPYSAVGTIMLSTFSLSHNIHSSILPQASQPSHDFCLFPKLVSLRHAYRHPPIQKIKVIWICSPPLVPLTPRFPLKGYSSPKWSLETFCLWNDYLILFF